MVKYLFLLIFLTACSIPPTKVHNEYSNSRDNYTFTVQPYIVDWTSKDFVDKSLAIVKEMYKEELNIDLIFLPTEYKDVPTNRFANWQEFNNNRANVTLYISGAFWIGDRIPIITLRGYAYVGCHHLRGCLAKVFVGGIPGSVNYNAKLIAHELGHTFGATHAMFGVMCPSAILQLFLWPISDSIDVSTGFSKFSVKQIRDFIESK